MLRVLGTRPSLINFNLGRRLYSNEKVQAASKSLIDQLKKSAAMKKKLQLEQNEDFRMPEAPQHHVWPVTVFEMSQSRQNLVWLNSAFSLAAVCISFLWNYGLSDLF